MPERKTYTLTVKVDFRVRTASEQEAAQQLQTLLKQALYDAGEILSVDVQGR